MLDLTAAGRDALLKRAIPVAAGLGVLLALSAGASRRRRPARRHTSPIVIEGPLLIVQTRPRRWRRK